MKLKKTRILGRLIALLYLIGKYARKNNNLAFYWDMLLFLSSGYSNKLNYSYTNYMLIKLTDSMIKDSSIAGLIFDEHLYKFSYPKQNPVIVDIGASVGLTTLYFKKIFPKAKVYAYEPYFPAYQALEENIRINDIQGGVKLFNSAVTRRVSSKKTLFVSSESSLMSSFYKNRIPKSNFNNIKKVAVRTVSLKSVVQKVGTIDILKLNIEGEEYKLIPEIIKYSDSIHAFIIGFHRIYGENPFKYLNELSKKYEIGVKSLDSINEIYKFLFSPKLKENFYAFGASRTYFNHKP